MFKVVEGLNDFGSSSSVVDFMIYAVS